MSEKVISDYNGYDYKKNFWEDADREYEDQADRMAIRKLLPKRMEKFADIGGGYGRLANEYLKRARKVYIFDYSKTELAQAKEIYGDKVETKAGDIYELPFKDNELDGLLMVRVTHHLKNMDKTIQIDYLYKNNDYENIIVWAEKLNPDYLSQKTSTFTTDDGREVKLASNKEKYFNWLSKSYQEVANKRTLPKMARYVTGRSRVNPFDKKVANYKEISKDGFYNYHPKYVEEIFGKVGFKCEKVLSVSNFRSKGLKKIFGTKNLVKMEDSAQQLLAGVRFAPSIYYKLRKPEE